MFLIVLEEIRLFGLLFSIVSPITFVSNPDSSSDLTIFIIFSISSFEIIAAVVPDP